MLIVVSKISDVHLKEMLKQCFQKTKCFTVEQRSFSHHLNFQVIMHINWFLINLLLLSCAPDS